ncbi:hypothetical protein C2E23DRAFT_889072 [Lenzites betulinus]|nr:hypothetical protein C2E23DRAFT_889072 [Lenzites betulinus]
MQDLSAIHHLFCAPSSSYNNLMQVDPIVDPDVHNPGNINDVDHKLNVQYARHLPPHVQYARHLPPLEDVAYTSYPHFFSKNIGQWQADGVMQPMMPLIRSLSNDLSRPHSGGKAIVALNSSATTPSPTAPTSAHNTADKLFGKVTYSLPHKHLVNHLLLGSDNCLRVENNFLVDFDQVVKQLAGHRRHGQLADHRHVHPQHAQPHLHRGDQHPRTSPQLQLYRRSKGPPCRLIMELWPLRSIMETGFPASYGHPPLIDELTHRPLVSSRRTQEITYGQPHFVAYETLLYMKVAIARMPKTRWADASSLGREFRLLADIVIGAFVKDLLQPISSQVRAEIDPILADRGHNNLLAARTRRVTLRKWLEVEHPLDWGMFVKDLVDILIYIASTSGLRSIHPPVWNKGQCCMALGMLVPLQSSLWENVAQGLFSKLMLNPWPI